MNTHFGMTSQKITDCLGLMRAQVVTDDVHGLLLGLACEEIFQKGDELCAGVAGAIPANDLPPPGIGGRGQQRRALAGITQTPSVRPARGGHEKPSPRDPPLKYHLRV